MRTSFRQASGGMCTGRAKRVSGGLDMTGADQHARPAARSAAHCASTVTRTGLLAHSTVMRAAGTTEWGEEGRGFGGNLDCDTRSHVVSELVKEVWLMPGT